VPQLEYTKTICRLLTSPDVDQGQMLDTDANILAARQGTKLCQCYEAKTTILVLKPF